MIKEEKIKEFVEQYGHLSNFYGWCRVVASHRNEKGEEFFNFFYEKQGSVKPGDIINYDGVQLQVERIF